MDTYHDVRRARAVALVAAAVWACLHSAHGAPSSDLLESPPGLELNVPPSACEEPLNRKALSLSEVVRAVMCDSPKVRQAAAEVAQEKGNVVVAEAKYYPTLSSTVTTNRIGKEVSYPDASHANYSLHTYSGNVDIGLSWLLFDSGKRGASFDKAKALWRASIYGLALTNREQVIAVADEYYRARTAAAGARAAEEASVRAELNFRATARLLSVGVGTLTEELLAKGAWQRSQADSEDRKRSARIATATLATKIGVPAREDLQLASEQWHWSDARNPMPELRKLDALLSMAILKNPRLSAARQRTLAAKAEVDVVAAEIKPSISLHANRYWSLTPPADSMAKQEIRGWSVGLQLRIPLFDGFSARHAAQAAQARAHAAALEERNMQMEEELKTLTDYENVLSGEREVSLFLGALESSEAAYMGAEARYRRGVGTLIELLKAQEELAKVTQDLIQAHYELLAAKFRIAIALDGAPMRPDF